MAMKRKTNGSDNKAADLISVQPSQRGDAPVVLSAEKYGGIRDVRARMDALSPQLANLTVQIEALSAQRSQIAREMMELDQRLTNSIRAAAQENGVQLEGQNWSFNIPSLTFSKMQQE